MATQAQKLHASAKLHAALSGPDRQLDVEIGRALGWRVSHDEWWNWRGYSKETGPVYDPPGDAWCIRRDARPDAPCNESLPSFTFMVRHDAQAIIDEA